MRKEKTHSVFLWVYYLNIKFFFCLYNFMNQNSALRVSDKNSFFASFLFKKKKNSKKKKIRIDE